MKTKLSKIPGEVTYDTNYIFQLGPHPTLFCKLRAQYWGDEHLRSLEIARFLMAGIDMEYSNRIFKMECEYLAQLGDMTFEAIVEEDRNIF